MHRWLSVVLTIGACSFVSASRAEEGARDWSGLYVGMHGGYKWADADLSHVGQPHFDPIGTNVDQFDLSGGHVGGHLGYQRQVGKLVFGVEVALASGEHDGFRRPSFFAPVLAETEVGSLFTAAARVGWDFGKSLIYIKGGYAAGELEVLLTESPNFDHSFTAISRSEGWVIGGGIEIPVHEKVSIGIDYQRVDLGTETFTGPDTSNFAITSVVVDPEPMDTVSARLSIKLGN